MLTKAFLHRFICCSTICTISDAFVREFLENIFCYRWWNTLCTSKLQSSHPRLLSILRPSNSILSLGETFCSVALATSSHRCVCVLNIRFSHHFSLLSYGACECLQLCIIIHEKQHEITAILRGIFCDCD